MRCSHCGKETKISRDGLCANCLADMEILGYFQSKSKKQEQVKYLREKTESLIRNDIPGYMANN